MLDIPTIRPHVLAMATMHQQSTVIVRVRCSDVGLRFRDGGARGNGSFARCGIFLSRARCISDEVSH